MGGYPDISAILTEHIGETAFSETLFWVLTAAIFVVGGGQMLFWLLNLVLYYISMGAAGEPGLAVIEDVGMEAIDTTLHAILHWVQTA